MINFDYNYLKHSFLIKNNNDYYNSVTRERHLFEKKYKKIYYGINFLKEDYKKYSDKHFIFNNNLCFNKEIFNNNEVTIINLYKIMIDFNYRESKNSKFNFQYKIININENQELFEKTIIINKLNLIDIKEFTEIRIINICEKEFKEFCSSY